MSPVIAGAGPISPRPGNSAWSKTARNSSGDSSVAAAASASVTAWSALAGVADNPRDNPDAMMEATPMIDMALTTETTLTRGLKVTGRISAEYRGVRSLGM